MAGLGGRESSEQLEDQWTGHSEEHFRKTSAKRYGRVFNCLSAIAYRTTRNHQMAEDAVQEAMLFITKRWETCPQSSKEFIAWVYGIVRRKAIDVWRTEYGKGSDSPRRRILRDVDISYWADMIGDVDPRYDEHDTREEANAALYSLDGLERQIFTDLYLRGMSRRVVAQFYQLPEKTLDSMVNRKRKRMRSSPWLINA